MGSPRKYDVIVCGKVVYTGLYRVSELVYSACLLTLQVVCESFKLDPVPIVVLAVHI